MERRRPGSASAIDATELGADFETVLTLGAVATSKGWLTIGNVSRAKALPKFFGDMPVVFLANRSGLETNLEALISKLCRPTPSPKVKRELGMKG